MSLMRTLARVAVGVAIAKGAKTLTQNARAGKSGTMLDDLMARGGSGGLGGLLDSLQGKSTGARGTRTSSSDFGGVAGGRGLNPVDNVASARPRTGAASGGMAGGGGLGGLLGALAGAASTDGFGSVLQSQLGNNDAPEPEPEPAQEGLAAVMLLAMVQAAQADGNLDEKERARILDHLGDATPQERAFVEGAMMQRMSTSDLAAQVPEGAEAQAYAMSVMAIDLDHPAEVDFLRAFADDLGLRSDTVNDIHAQMGVVPLYS